MSCLRMTLPVALVMVSSILLCPHGEAALAPLFPDPVYRAGDGPLWITTGDFNGDGLADAAVSSYRVYFFVTNNSDVRVFLGDGGGHLTPSSNPGTGVQPFGSAAVDLNGDGNDDLVVANFGSSDISVLISRGDGTFLPEARTPVGSFPVFVCAGDLNGDARADLAVIVQGDSTILLMEGDGQGAFVPAGSLTALVSPSACLLQRLDGDASLDLVVASSAMNDVSVFRGVGDGSFHPEIRYPVGRTPESLAAADFDQDGSLDLAAGNNLSRDISILYGRGDGTYDPEHRVISGIAGSSLAAGDLEGDGIPDLVVAVSGFFTQGGALGASLHGNGNRTFASPVSLGIEDIAAVAVRDLDRDGVQDLLASRSGSLDFPYPGSMGPALLVRRSSTEGDPPPPVVTELGSSEPLAAGDLDGDGRQDLIAVVNDPSYAIVSLLGQGDGHFVQADSLSTFPHPLVLGDLNGDDYPDLVGFGSAARVFLGQGDGTFLPGTQPPSTGVPISGALADVNGDGLLDLLLGYSAPAEIDDGDVGIRLGQGDGTFGPEQRYGAGPYPDRLQTADFDEDGALDIVTTNGRFDTLNPGRISILDGRGDGTFEPERRLLESSLGGTVLAGDMNGDGHADLLVANTFLLPFPVEDQRSFLLSGDGSGQLTAGEFFTTDIMAANRLGDFDGDGDLDVADATHVVSAPVLVVTINDGHGRFDSPARLFAASPVSDGLAAADFDGDGRLDLVTGGLSVHLNNGPFPNLAPTAVALAPSPVECASAGGTPVLLDGTGSSDDQGIVSYEWLLGETLLGQGAILQVELPLGEHEITLRVTDGGGLTGTSTILVLVTDTAPPSLTVAATPALLWPPNGDHHDVHVTADANDACGPVSVALVSITSSEPDPDAILDADPGTPDFDVRLQADKTGQTRIYTLVYRTTDGSGHTAEASTTVEVRKTKLRR
ncbi:MAG: FG-GAP-like repeat-containing protein [Candidatus Polarisedimenticolia bacterium]